MRAILLPAATETPCSPRFVPGVLVETRSPLGGTALSLIAHSLSEAGAFASCRLFQLFCQAFSPFAAAPALLSAGHAAWLAEGGERMWKRSVLAWPVAVTKAQIVYQGRSARHRYTSRLPFSPTRDVVDSNRKVPTLLRGNQNR